MSRFLLIVMSMIAAVGFLGQSTAASAANVLVPQKGVGAKYGGRDPYTCTSKMEPKTGAISADMATQYFICQWEKVNGNGILFLAQNVHVEVGKPLGPAQRVLVINRDANPDGLVYPIRGSFDNYLCSVVDNTYPPHRSGHNCAVWHETHATGDCYRTGFGDWSCMMNGSDAQQIDSQPPPGFKPVAAAAPVLRSAPSTGVATAQPAAAPPPASLGAAPSPSMADIEAGMRLFQKRDYRGAYKKFHAAVKEDYYDPLPWLWEGVALDALGQISRLDYLHGSSDLHKLGIAASELLALSGWHNGGREDAKRYLDTCISFHPEDSSCADMKHGIESGASAPPVAEWPAIVGLIKITTAHQTVWHPAQN